MWCCQAPSFSSGVCNCMSSGCSSSTFTQRARGLQPIPGSIWLGPRLEIYCFSSFPPLQTRGSKSTQPGLYWPLSLSCHWSVQLATLGPSTATQGILASPYLPLGPLCQYRFPDAIPNSSLNVLPHSLRHQSNITPWVLI